MTKGELSSFKQTALVSTKYSSLFRHSNTKETSIHNHRHIRLRPGITTSFIAVAAPCSLHLSASRPLRPNVTSDIKAEVHNIAQRRHRRTEPLPHGIYAQNFVKIGPAVPEICWQTAILTDRQVDHNSPHQYRSGVKRKLH